MAAGVGGVIFELVFMCLLGDGLEATMVAIYARHRRITSLWVWVEYSTDDPTRCKSCSLSCWNIPPSFPFQAREGTCDRKAKKWYVHALAIVHVQLQSYFWCSRKAENAFWSFGGTWGGPWFAPGAT